MAFESGSSSSRSKWTYDVFLSFRGEDTRKNFTDHLYGALVKAQIRTFRGDLQLPRGEEFSPLLLKAIRKSKISVVIFSKGYASSTWCLNELVEIFDCRRTNKHQIVFPIFYDIDPSDVRKQSGSFKAAFDRHEKCFKEKVNMWREALLEAGNLYGLNMKDMEKGHESRSIPMIVRYLLKNLYNKFLPVAEYPVGIDSHVHRIINLLSNDTNDVCIVGICGMPGIGKTTIAKAVFNRLFCGYDGCCFLSNVNEISKGANGLVRLQEQLLLDILKPKVFKIHNKDSGINLIKAPLHWKRVLIVVDDVDHLEQLRAFVGGKNWFGPGSRIIITTRDEHLLTRFDVYKIYMVQELDQHKSLQLFSSHAFKDSHPLEDFLELSRAVVEYSGGLPLALKVLGSSLFNKSKTEWMSAIEKLRKIPRPYIQQKLRVSFDALDNDTKPVFLDISCFFIGRDREYVGKILHARYGFCQNFSIMTLIERSLLTIDAQNKLRMHDLLRDMGREIVPQMSPRHPGKRSRIWSHEDALVVLKQLKGAETVEGLTLDMPASEEAVFFSTESFKEMKRLKLLKINGIQLIGSYEHLFKELIWLCWFKCPLESLPSNLQLDNIAVLDIQYSNLKILWKEIKFLKNLKILDLSHSKYLVETPNFEGISNLGRLILEDCPSLIGVHPSIGHLRRLVFLSFEGCCRLRKLPQSICNLKCLENLNLNMCSKFKKLPESLGDMESLTELLLDETAITQLPISIGNLRKLRKLSLRGCNYEQNSPSTLSPIRSPVSGRISRSKALLPASLSRLDKLVELNLSNCGLSEGAISFDLGSLSSLKYLNLSGNKFVNLPSDLYMEGKIDIYISESEAAFNVLLETDSSDNWEPTTLVLRRSGLELKSSGKKIVVAAEKSSKDISIIAAELSTQVVLTYSDGSSHRLSTYDERMHNTLLLTMEMFQSEALEDDKKGIEAPRLSYLLKEADPKLKSELQDQSDQAESSAARARKTLEMQQPLEEEAEFCDLVQANKNESEDRYEPSSETRQPMGPNDIQKKLILLQRGMRLTAPPKFEEWESSAEIYLMDNELSDLPDSLRCPGLQALFLQRNKKLRKIPPLFFDYMPALQLLNLSRTRIKSLPESLFRLVNLRRLFLNHCHLLTSLSPDVGKLELLEVLDLEGTKILELPEEVKKLTKLTSLEVSFLEPMNHRRSEQSNALVPLGILSALSRLEELNIDVSPDDERWEECVEEIVSEVTQLTALDTLKFYLPRAELLGLFTCFSTPIVLPSLLHFQLTVGRHAQRIMPRLPQDVEFELERYDRCLKYIIGESVPEDIKMVLRQANAFFLDRHATVKKLSDFGLGNLKQVRCCVLGECNELQGIVDGDEIIGSDDVMQSLEYLYLYYLKNLKSIWTGPLLIPTLHGLKFLTLSTCPQLTIIFTPALLVNLNGLEQLTVNDCAMITSLVSCNDSKHAEVDFLPNLKRISLHFLPELTSISSGLRISARLEWMSFYYCPNLKNLPISKELNGDLQKIKGERSWWEDLEGGISQQQCWDGIFVPIDECD